MADIVLASNITAVTVYSDRAQITRRAQTQLKPGDHTLVFSQLPENIDPDSLHASGSGKAVLRDVKFERKHLTAAPNERMRALEAERQRLREAREVLDDHANRIHKERQFIERIVETLTANSDEPSGFRLEPERWIKMVEFHRSRLEALDTEQRDVKRRRHQLDDDLAKAEHELSELGGGGTRIEYQVGVVVEATAEGEVAVELSYLVHGPNWHPVYDLRVDGTLKRMTIGYQAMVSQASGEDWGDVALKLSTAQPGIGGEQPDLSPWHLHEYTPPPPSPVPVAAKVRRPSPENAFDTEEVGGLNQLFRAESAILGEGHAAGASASAPKEKLDWVSPGAGIETQATSVVFTIPAGQNIPSDGQPHRVQIFQEDFPAHFRYSCVPKLAPHAYLKAKVSNASDYPFLPGETRVFLDNQFVANARMKLVSPGEEFWTFLGIDSAIKIEHQQLKRVRSQSGLINKSERYVYDFLIKLTNNKKTPEEIVVWDQLPISNHEKIAVTLQQPNYRGDNDQIKKNELNYLEWFFRLEPGEKREVPLSFVVDYPQGMTVTGL